jgi:hypothetical protein
MVARRFIVCEDSAGGLTAAPCPAGQEPVTVELTAVAEPVDYSEAALYFAFPIVPIIGVYMLAFAVGSIVKVVGDS